MGDIDAHHGSLMSCQGVEQCARFRRPQTYRHIFATGGDEQAIRREDDIINVSTMSGEDMQWNNVNGRNTSSLREWLRS